MSAAGDMVTTRRDPKLWPTYLKFATLANICFFVFLGNMHSAGITTGFHQLAEQFNVSLAKCADQVAYPVLAQGFANLIWMPTALCVGKRPIMLLTIAMLCIGCIWASVANTFESLLGSRIFASIFSGAVESLGPSMIADMFFEKNFALSMAAFSLSLGAGSQLGPLIAGYLIAAKGWRWLFYLLIILTAVNLLLATFFMPETSFHRVWYEGETAADVDKQAVQQPEDTGDKLAQEGSTASTAEDHHTKSYGSGYWPDLFKFKVDNVDYHGPRYWTYQFLLPLRFLVIPGSLFASIAFGTTLGWSVIISTITPTLMSPPPYNFTSIGLGLFGLAAFVGILIAFPFAGPLTDLLSSYLGKRAARRDHTSEYSNGHKPEHRLPALILPFIVTAPGLLIFGYSYIPVTEYAASMNPHSGIHIPSNPWLRPAIGYAMAGSGLALVPSVMLSYVVDAYPQTGGEALVLINTTKGVIACVLSKVAATWLANTGVKTMFLEMAGIQWGILSFALPLYFAGPWIRKITARWL